MAESYPGIGRCIYCGKAAVRLTKEHILPYALGGHAFIREASCDDCCAKTSAVEGRCAKGFFSEIRSHLALPSRRKAARPSKLPFIAVTEAGEQIFQVPIVNHPYRFTTVVFRPATLLKGSQASSDTQTRVVSVQFQSDYARRVAVQNAIAHVEEVAVDYLALAAMVAKVAHAAAVAQLGSDAFEPCLVGVILGNEAFAHYVGSVEASIGDRSDDKTLHRWRFNVASVGGVTYIVCDLQLFSFLGAPAFRIVVGRQLKDLPSWIGIVCDPNQWP